jgi:predicted ArsR family transcriptional regulator
MPAPERTLEEGLPLLRALGDETRLRCYEVVRDAPRPISVPDVALMLGLHQNTVRPHLERLREVGLVEVEAQQRGTVGRPLHLYSIAPDAPPLGLGPRGFHLLSEMLVSLASRLASPDDAVEVGREWGRRVGLQETPTEAASVSDPVELIGVTFQHLGFDPTADGDTVGFGHCPFRELAEAHPELVCSLHRGMCEGLVEISNRSARVSTFHPLGSRDPCTVGLTRKAPARRRRSARGTK